MATRLFYSNTIETLALKCAEVLDEDKGFQPKSIITPNPYLKKWLQLFIARVSGISANCNFQHLDHGLWEITAILEKNEKTARRMLTQDILQYLIYHFLISFNPGDTALRPFTGYLYDKPRDRKADFDRRAWQLSDRLSRYFIEYEHYREEMIKKWDNGLCLYNTEMEQAQRSIYSGIFKKKGLRDRYDPHCLTLPQYWKSVSHAPTEDFPRLYLFGKSQLSPFHTGMIYELGKIMDITIFQLNPCSEFWEDVSTPGEDRWDRIRSIKLDSNTEGEYIADRENENRLLKLWGKSGRETLKLLSLLEDQGSRELSFSSEWLYPQQLSDDSCLHMLQNQILMRSSVSDSDRLPQDTSIQISACPDIYREVETVYNSIIYNLDADSRSAMTDIAVMVPDMDAYGPVIKSVFSQTPRRIEYSIIDSSASVESLLGKGIMSLLDIAAGSFTRAEIFSLIYNQCFLDAHGLSADNAASWLSWADRLNIFRQFINKDGACPGHNNYTWLQGLQRLRLGRIMEIPDTSNQNQTMFDYKKVVPFSDKSSDDLSLINTFNQIIELLYYRLKRINEGPLKAEEWIYSLRELISDFLTVPKHYPEEAFVLQSLNEELQKLLIFDSIGEHGPILSLSFIREFIKAILKNISFTQGSYLTSGVNISALVPKRQIPFKIIYIMGMGEGIFPGVADSSSLNLRNIRRKIGDITRPDANRYLFLEAIISAREKIYISYISRDLQRDQVFSQNSVVSQLQWYLSNYIVEEEFKTIDIPFSGSSTDYLSDQNIVHWSDLICARKDGSLVLVNYSESERLIMLSNFIEENDGADTAIVNAIEQKIQDAVPLFHCSGGQSRDSGPDLYTIHIRELAGFLKNPIESSLRRHLDIYDDIFDDRRIIEDEPFYSTFPFNFSIIRDSLYFFLVSGSKANTEKYLGNHYKQAQLKSETPAGAFGEIDYDQISSMLSDRIIAQAKGTSLNDLVNSKSGWIFLQNLAFGQVMTDGSPPDRVFPPVNFSIKKNNSFVELSLSGSIPCLWKNDDTGELETVVITNSSGPRITHCVSPFLFYVVSKSGILPELRNFIGDGPFTVHVSHRQGISSYCYSISSDICCTYIKEITGEFLNEESYDLIPLILIASSLDTLPLPDKSDPDDSIRTAYQETLSRLILDDSEKSHPMFDPMTILTIIDPEIPHDAYDKVRDRLTLLMQPFIKEN